MSDEDLRSLERELATGGAEARLRYADALRRVGRRGEAMQALEPLLERGDATGAVAEIRAAALYFEDGDDEAGLKLLAREGLVFSEAIRAEYERVAGRLDELLDPKDDGRTGAALSYGLRAAAAIGKLAPLEELVRAFKKMPARRTPPWAVRHRLAMSIQVRDRATALELAMDEPDSAVAAVLRAEGTLLI